jgi:hypothetical protein
LAVVRPTRTEEVQAVLRWATAHRVPVVPRGMGTGLSGGATALDAPVSGGDVGARNAALSIMVGGDPSAFARAEPLFARLGKTVVHHGDAGSGQRVKIVNQVHVAANPLGMCEALSFGASAGLDPRGRRELIELLTSLTQTLIVSTHDLELARAAFARSIVVDGGVIVADGPTAEILGNRELLLAHGLA